MIEFRKQLTFLIILSIFLVSVFTVNPQVGTESSPYDLVISGLVENPLNFTYNELQRFPMVSEVALLECIAGPPYVWLYNWTGIPLFFLLSMTGVKAGAMEVVFYASDGFSSSLTIERTLHPTTILALQANGTVLSDWNGYPYRLVVPCKYGYKWVKWITKIEVVDYDYKGTCESVGFSDEANIPNCTFPSTKPPFDDFHIFPGSTNHSIITLSNSTIYSFDFDTFQKQICFNVTGPSSTTGYCYITIPKELLWCDNPEQWQVWANNTLIEDRKIMETANYTYIYFNYNHNIREVRIKGVHVIPYVGVVSISYNATKSIYEIQLEFNATLNEGNNLTVKFYSYSRTYQEETKVWTGTTPTYIIIFENVSHPLGLPIEIATLKLTNESGGVISTLTAFTMHRYHLMSRLAESDSAWSYVSPAERTAIFKEIVDIALQWPYAPQ